MQTWFKHEIDTLYPGSFALVMATGIISNALYLENAHGLSNVLYAVNLLAYPWLLAATLLRALRVPRAMWSDLTNPRLVFSFFTMVAATDVLGAGIALRGFAGVALVMWLFAFALWFVLIYLSFGVLTFLNTAHGANVVHGGWLIAIVGTQSLVVLGTQIAPALPSAPLIFFVLKMVLLLLIVV